MTRSATFAVAAMLTLAPIAISAHEGHNHKKVMGTVKSIDTARIELSLKGGGNQTIPLSKRTMVMRGKEMVGVDQVKSGMRVIVVLGEDGKTAETIKLGVPSK